MFFKKNKNNYKLNKDELDWLDAIIDSYLKPISLKNSMYRVAHVISKEREKQYSLDLEYEVFLQSIKYKIQMQIVGNK